MPSRMVNLKVGKVISLSEYVLDIRGSITEAPQGKL